MPAKRRKIDNDHIFDDWKDEDNYCKEDDKDDVAKYMAVKFSDELTNSFLTELGCYFDKAKFWCDEIIQSMFPKLWCVAIGVLSIPASSMSSERVFSTTGCILEKRRTQLSAKSLDSIVYLNSKYHNNGEFLDKQ